MASSECRFFPWFEENWARGGFMTFVNTHIGTGLPLLTIRSIFWINNALVWILFLAVGAVMRWISPALVLVPVYATLISALVHTAGTVRLCSYNPGLVTANLLFIPWRWRGRWSGFAIPIIRGERRTWESWRVCWRTRQSFCG